MLAGIEVFSYEIAALLAAAIVAGFIRGFTGGMGANAVLAPALALIVGAQQAVPIVILLNVLTSFQLMPAAAKLARWGEVIPMAAAGLLMAPLGVYALLLLDQDLMRRAVAATAVTLTVLLLIGWRYTGPRGTKVAIGVGGVAGFLNGAVSIGGPPVIFYLLSGPDNSATNRAHFISYATIIQPITLIVFIVNDAINTHVLVYTLIIFLPFAAAVWVGSHKFKNTSEKTFRRFAMGVMFAVSLFVLVI